MRAEKLIFNVSSFARVIIRVLEKPLWAFCQNSAKISSVEFLFRDSVVVTIGFVYEGRFIL